MNLKSHFGHIAILTIFACLLACGGGGGGGGNNPTTAQVRFSVVWGERSRELGGLNSALSMVLRISGAGVPSGDFIWMVNRGLERLEHTVNYVSGTLAKSGTHTVTATFYADENGAGDVVATATGPMTVRADGILDGTISTVGTITSVQVAAGQSVGAGQSQQLVFTCRDTTGGLIAVTPGSALWSVVSGADNLSFTDGFANGLIVGNATVSASVDGIASAAASITISSNPNITVTISPQVAIVPPNGSHQFSATVNGAANQDVTWNVATVGGGSIDGTGLYMAPGFPMYATVEARSVADPSKFQTAMVTVQSDTLTVTVTPNPVTISPNGIEEFAAVVDGSPNQDVSWSVDEASGGSIDSGGNYTASSVAGTYTIRATSVADPSFSGTAQVEVVTPNAVSVVVFDAIGRAGALDIYMVDSDGSNLRNLTDHPADDYGARVSADGNTIWFTSGRSGNPEIWKMNSDGSNPQQVSNVNSLGIHAVNHIALHPLGTEIAFDQGVTIQHVTTTGTYLPPIGFGVEPVFEPSESRVIFVREGDIFSSKTDGSDIRQITNTVEQEALPNINPDGTEMCFLRKTSGFWEVWKSNLSGGPTTQITFAQVEHSRPVWSVDGSKIIFGRWGSIDPGLFIVDSDGSNESRLTIGLLPRYPSVPGS